MKIKPWQYFSVIGGLAVIYIYVKRNNIKNFFNTNETARNLIAKYAIKWVGTQETGNNNGFANQEFQKMMEQIGWKSGDQWCVWFCKAVYVQAFPNDRANIDRIFGYGNSQDAFRNAQNDNTGTFSAITSGNPMVGDVAIWKRSEVKGHAGIVVDVNLDNGTYTTIEGNTSDASIRDGELVAKKVHPLGYGVAYGENLKLKGFIRKNKLI